MAIYDPNRSLLNKEPQLQCPSCSKTFLPQSGWHPQTKSLHDYDAIECELGYVGVNHNDVVKHSVGCPYCGTLFLPLFFV